MHNLKAPLVTRSPNQVLKIEPEAVECILSPAPCLPVQTRSMSSLSAGLTATEPLVPPCVSVQNGLCFPALMREQKQHGPLLGVDSSKPSVLVTVCTQPAGLGLPQASE